MQARCLHRKGLSLTLALSRGERGFRGVISPAGPMEKRTDRLEKKYARIG